MTTTELNSASFYTLAYHVRRRVEQLIQEQDYTFLPQELAVFEGAAGQDDRHFFASVTGKVV